MVVLVYFITGCGGPGGKVCSFLTLGFDGDELSASPWYPLNRSLGGPQTYFGCFGAQKYTYIMYLLVHIDVPCFNPGSQRCNFGGTTNNLYLQVSFIRHNSISTRVVPIVMSNNFFVK